MVSEWLKNRARFCLSCNYSYTLYLSVKIKEVKLKKIHTSACLNLNYDTTKRKPKIVKMVEFIEICDQYPRKFNLGHFFSSIVLPFFCWGNIQKRCSGKMSNFLLPGVIMLRTWGRILLEDIIKNEHIQFFDSQMHFPVILLPWIWILSATMVQYTGLRKNSRNILEK